MMILFAAMLWLIVGAVALFITSRRLSMPMTYWHGLNYVAWPVTLIDLYLYRRSLRQATRRDGA